MMLWQATHPSNLNFILIWLILMSHNNWALLLLSPLLRLHSHLLLLLTQILWNAMLLESLLLLSLWLLWCIRLEKTLLIYLLRRRRHRLLNYSNRCGCLWLSLLLYRSRLLLVCSNRRETISVSLIPLLLLLLLLIPDLSLSLR